MIYTITCNPAVDYVMHINVLQPGMVNRSNAEQISFGGKGINISLILNELKVPSVALGFVAGFTGDAIEHGVQSKGVRTDFIHLRDGFSRINLKIRSDMETELNGQGPLIKATDIAALFDKLDQLSDGDTIILAGSVPHSMPMDTYAQILAHLSEKKIRAVVDASGDLLRDVLPYKPFLVKPNHHELGELFGVALHTVDQIAVYASRLQQMGAQNVLVSMAGDGALLLDENGCQHVCAACSGSVRNSVGAGDSMVAGFLAGLEKSDFDIALRLGTAAGGATAFSDGLAQAEEIYRLFDTLQEL